MTFEHTFRQSWLGTYFECPEQARLVLRGEYPVDNTEAALKGTCMHEGIERVLKGDSVASGLTTALDKFEADVVSLGSDLRFVQTQRVETCLRHIENGYRQWATFVWPTLGAASWVEEQFKFLFYEDDDRRIFLSGTVDYGEYRSALRDWKLTGNRDKYGREAWKLKRFGIQPTVYAAAAYELGLFLPTDDVKFIFTAMPTTGIGVQLVDCIRTPQHIDWLRRQCLSIARQIERGTEDTWPLRDQSALCSPEWCTAWDTCKGAYFNG